jgi:hypothetical protein
MLAGRDRPTTFKLPLQQFQIGDQIYVHPSPIRKPSAARAANLICEKSRNPLLDSIIMRFDNPFPIAVAKSNNASLTDRSS